MSLIATKRLPRMTRLFAPFAVIAGLAGPVAADPTIGLGLSFAFGAGKMEAGVGLRVFSTNQRDKFAGTIGLDYMFQSGRLRPTVGAAYMGSNSYLGLDLGIGLNGGGLDFGISGGVAKTKKRAAAVVLGPA